MRRGGGVCGLPKSERGLQELLCLMTESERSLSFLSPLTSHQSSHLSEGKSGCVSLSGPLTPGSLAFPLTALGAACLQPLPSSFRGEALCFYPRQPGMCWACCASGYHPDGCMGCPLLTRLQLFHARDPS